MTLKGTHRQIGNSSKVFVIAEISANHKQNFKNAVALIKKAKECSADAVKFQAYTPDTITLNINNKYFRIKHPKWQTLYDLYKTAYTPWDWFKKLKKISDDMGIEFFATAFDKTSVDMLEDIGVRIHKVASFELVDLPLIDYIARTKKPLILSTGMASLAEIKEAVGAARMGGAKCIYLLKCVSSYPAKAEDMNLRTIPHMQKTFGLPVGISDHTLDMGVSLAAVALGASAVEKHLTLSRRNETADSSFSTEPHEFKELVQQIRIVEKAIGSLHYGATKGEINSRSYRRSLFAAEDIGKGGTITAENMRSVRPASGLPPKYYKTLFGRKVRVMIKKGTPLNWDMVR